MFRSEHPLRERLHGELHARPSLCFDGDSDVWHVAVFGSAGTPVLPARLLNLEALAATQPDKNGIGQFAGGRLKWEAHTEFLTLTFVTPPDDTAGKPPDAFGALVNEIEGDVIVAARVSVRLGKDGGSIPRRHKDAVASSVGGGDADVYSDFRLPFGESDTFIDLVADEFLSVDVVPALT